MASTSGNVPPACRRGPTPRRKQTITTTCSYDGCGGQNSDLLYCGYFGCKSDNKKVHRACEEAYAKGQRMCLISFPRCLLCAKAAAGKYVMTPISTSTGKTNLIVDVYYHIIGLHYYMLCKNTVPEIAVLTNNVDLYVCVDRN